MKRNILTVLLVGVMAFSNCAPAVADEVVIEDTPVEKGSPDVEEDSESEQLFEDAGNNNQEDSQQFVEGAESAEDESVHSEDMEEVQMYVGDKQSFTIYFRINPSITFQNSNESVAVPNQSGYSMIATPAGFLYGVYIDILGLSEGSNYIDVYNYSTLVQSYHVTVTPVPVEEIAVDPTELTIHEGSKTTVTAQIIPYNATHQDVAWKTSDETVAKITGEGTQVEIEAVNPGEATITVETVEGNKTANCRITVKGKEHIWDPNYIVVTDPTCLEDGLKKTSCVICGEEKTIAIPATGHTWNTEATIDKEATCTEDGQKSIHCTVCDAVKEDSVEVVPAFGHDWDEGIITTKPGCIEAGVRTYHCNRCSETKTKEIPATGHDFSDWETIVEATALKAGKQSRTCFGCGKIEYKKLPKLEATISLNVTSLKLNVGQNTSNVKVTKMTAGDYVKSWTSSNRRIVTVTKKGSRGSTIKGLKAGKATITVKLASGKTKKFTVTVQDVRTTKLVLMSKKTVTLKVGKTSKIIVSRTPRNATDKITYTSSNKKVAIVDKSGKIKAVKKGKATITVMSGSKKVTVKVVVK